MTRIVLADAPWRRGREGGSDPVVALLRAVEHPDPRLARGALGALLAAFGGDDDLVRWAELGARQRLLPALARRAQDLAAPPALREAAARAVAVSWALNEQLLCGVRPLLDAFAAADIPVLAIKGLALLGEEYPQHAARPLGDLDLLVPASALARADAILQRAGWRSPLTGRLPREARHATAVRGPDGTQVDLHWRPARAFAVCGHLERELWRRARPVAPTHPLAGTGLLRPSAAHHLLVLAAHAAQQPWRDRPHQLADVHRLLVASPDLSGDALLPAAVEERLVLRLRRVVELAAVVCGTPLPGGLRDELHSTAAALPARARRFERRMVQAHHRTVVGGGGPLGGAARAPAKLRILTAGQTPRNRLRITTATTALVARRLLRRDTGRRTSTASGRAPAGRGTGHAATARTGD